jgi:hypothetical protein
MNKYSATYLVNGMNELNKYYAIDQWILKIYKYLEGPIISSKELK